MLLNMKKEYDKVKHNLLILRDISGPIYDFTQAAEPSLWYLNKLPLWLCKKKFNYIYIIYTGMLYNVKSRSPKFQYCTLIFYKKSQQIDIIL